MDREADGKMQSNISFLPSALRVIISFRLGKYMTILYGSGAILTYWRRASYFRKI